MNYNIEANHPTLKNFSETVLDVDAEIIISWLVSLSYEILQVIPSYKAVSFSAKIAKLI